MTETTIRPPTGLRAATRKWFVEVCARWVLEPHHVRLLAQACRAYDQAEAAAALIRTDGLIVTMPSGAKRPNPAIRIANEARALYARLLRELDLDLEPPTEAQRPPQLRSMTGRRRHAP